MFKKIILTLFILLFLAIAGGCGLLYWIIVVEPGEEIQADNIHKILGRESTVYYNDGINKLGVFFDTAHRQYVDYGEIPSDFVNALIAAEDNRFFNHFGFDIVGIFRAILKNIEAGRIVQGGSSLTQQTAKNLFKRTERSYEAKLKELIYALRLEYHYSKEKIFEFYANQFYVSGNGHGLGVAARYYFDKKPEELTLVQCAFIAGSVKKPNYYNPFRNKSEERTKLTQARAKIRLKYVLGQMRKLGMIDLFTYKGALISDLEFKNGKVGYDLDHAMELVRDAVSSAEVSRALEEHGINNIATSGIRIFTTIDLGLQNKSLRFLRSELSRLDVRLRGYEREEVQTELAKLEYKGDSLIEKGAYIFGTVKSIEGEGEKTRIHVALDKKLGDGFIDAEGLETIVTARVKYQKNRWSEAGKKDLDGLLQQIQVGDRVWVSVRDDVPEKPALLALEKFPLIQGASIVVQDGRIVALAGGGENRFFNRAFHAKRTMGSAFKPLVYTAAIQLGWNSADLLKNKRELFVYHDQPYFPRPDHKSPYEWVSMSWAGVHSENVASVWLLSRLCDKLTPLQFREVADHLGLAPKEIDGEQEPYRSYRSRIRDRFGIQVNKRILKEAAYIKAVKNLETDFIFDGMISEYKAIKELRYGLNFDKFQEDLDKELAKRKKPVKKHYIAEYELRRKILSNSYLKLEKIRDELTEFRQNVVFGDGNGFFVEEYKGTEEMSDGLEKTCALYINRMDKKFYFLSPQSEMIGVAPIPTAELRSYLQQLDGEEVAQFWENIELEGGIRVEVFDKVRDQLDHEYEKLLSRLPYDFDVLSGIRDFRTTVGLSYLVLLGKELGLKSKLEPVLSFPLGSNVVTLFEATRMYEGLVKGEVSIFRSTEERIFTGADGDEDLDMLAILDRIESYEGEILYQPKTKVTRVVDSKTGLMVSSILENIVKFGTGRYADRHVKFTGEDDEKVPEIEELSLSVPLLGKTGTANNYTNAAFLGFVPEVADDRVAMSLKGGYAVGVYVGFDDNTPMRRKTSRISGAAGALPGWSKIANALQKERKFATRLDPVDLSFYGLGIKREKLGQINLGVDVDNGGTVIEPIVEIPEISRKQPSILTFGQVSGKGRLTVTRSYNPYWITKNELTQ